MLPKLLIPHNAAPIWLHSEVIMAAIGLHRGSDQARIRRSGYPTITKTFVRKKDAVAWAVLTERKIEQDEYVADGLIKVMTLADLLDRYQEEITPTKRSAEYVHKRICKDRRKPDRDGDMSSLNVSVKIQRMLSCRQPRTNNPV